MLYIYIYIYIYIYYIIGGKLNLKIQIFSRQLYIYIKIDRKIHR